MNPKEATIIAYALDFLLRNGDERDAEALQDFANEKDMKFLLTKYESLSNPYNPNEDQ
jgi:hypothetical protein